MEYNYLDAVKTDSKNYIINDLDIDKIKAIFPTKELLREFLYDRLWVEDSVTGNASGSYTFNTYMAEEYLCHNIDLLKEALYEFGYDKISLDKSAEWFDVTIRCYVLSDAIGDIIDELFSDLPEE